MPTRRFFNTYGDYVGNYNFRVELAGILMGYCTAVDGLSIENEVIEYDDGDDPWIRKRPGRVKYGDITLKKGYINTPDLIEWIRRARLGIGDYPRREMSIVLCDNSDPIHNAQAEIKRWNLFECLPKSWKMASLDGKGNDVLFEEVVIAYEWFEEA